MFVKKIKWVEPLAFASRITDKEKCWVLLHSSMAEHHSGRYSILAMDSLKEIKSSDFTKLGNALSDKKRKFENAWFGYLGYGLKNKLESLPKDKKGIFDLPDLWMVNFGTILVFDNKKKTLNCYSRNNKEITLAPQALKNKNQAKVKKIKSNMTKDSYLNKVKEIKKSIKNGDLYQANLTRKFNGEFKGKPQPFAIFRKLAEISPSPYSAFMKFGDLSVISSSPECFLKIDEDGIAYSEPIKGSAARMKDRKKDAVALKNLKQSEKDKAENLMIVDLMRNDFSRGAVGGSVVVNSMFDITSYATVHHMSSKITGRKRSDVPTLEFVKNCFPPGSMTGTPKIKAMELCTRLEKDARGIYSGAIGYFGGDGSADLSVVIRTIIIKGKKFEFQVGGAIVADSRPESEFKETIFKAKAVARALGIKANRLEKL